MRKPLLILGFVALAGGLAWHLLRPAAAPASEPARETTAWVETEDARLQLQLNRAEVFRRAFWRQPTAAENILHAERRHRLREPNGGVQEWQWFIALEPGDAFAAWLLEENPFELVAAPAGTVATLADAPDWMPNRAALARMTHYRKPGSNLQVFRDPATGRLYATDAGGGFNLAQK